MAVMTAPDKALLAMFDRIAYQKEAAILAGTGGTKLWDIVDATDDETFENRVENPELTALDAAIAAMYLGDFVEMAPVLANIVEYTNLDLALGAFDTYLTDRRTRIDLRAAEIWQECYHAGVLSIANIHSRADGGAAAPGLELCHMVGDGAGGGAFTAGADMSETTNSPSPVLARITVHGGVANWDVVVTCKHATDVGAGSETELIDLTIPLGGGVGDTYIVGEELMSGAEAVGQTIIELAATAQFLAGQKVLLTQWSAGPAWDQQEIATIASVQDGVSITLTAGTRYGYTASATTFVYPLFIGVELVTDGAGANGDNNDAIYFYPAPDRQLAL